MLRTLSIFAFALSLWASNPVEPEPRYLFRFYVDDVPVDTEKGASASANNLSIGHKLDESSAVLYPELVRQPTEMTFTITIARGDRPLANVDWQAVGRLPFFRNAQAGDRVVVKVKAIWVRQKDGIWRAINRQVGEVHMFGLY